MQTADLEKKLAEYRAKRERDARINEAKTRLKSLWQSITIRKKEAPQQEDGSLYETLIEEATYDDAASMISDDGNLDCLTYSNICYYLSWFTLWGLLYGIFIQLEFGTVYLIISAIVFMYINTRTRPKASNEISAYSVFNKNCESIDGTLKAEQFEREIRYGPASIR